MGLIEDLRQKYEQSGRGRHFDEGLARAIDIIVRQTDLSRASAAEGLERNKLNVLATIREAAGCPADETPIADTRTLNQRMYAEYRGFLDDASRKHTIEKEKRERRENALSAIAPGTLPSSDIKTQKSD